MNNRIFISGRVTGDPDYVMKFKSVKGELFNARRNCTQSRPCNGCPFYDRDHIFMCRISDVFPKQLEIVNPVDLGLEGKNYWIALFKCLRKLRKCHYVYMLSDWQESRGARWEHRVARFLKKQIIYQKPIKR